MPKGAIEGKRARDYEARYSSWESMKAYDRFILENVRKGISVRVCDFACGPGNDIALLKGHVGELTGVDLSDEMISICQEKFGKDTSVKLLRSSITDTGLPSSHFDYVIIRMGIHHVKDKDKVMEEAYRVLKPKGKLIIIDKYYLNLWELYSKAFYKLFFQMNPAIFQEYLVSKKRYDELFSRSRFKIIKKETLPYDKKHTGQAFMCLLER